MAVQTANMGLTKWTDLNDFFSHSQLGANWDAIDAHDHSPGHGAPLGSDSFAGGAISTTKLQDGSVTAVKLGSNSVTTAKLNNLAVTTGKIADGAVTMAKLASTVSSGTYTPACTRVTNIDAVSAGQAQYLRVGSVVTVSGTLTVDATISGNFLFGVGLPITSNFSNVSNLGGASIMDGGTGDSRVRADVANDRAEFGGKTTITSAQTWSYTFTYLIR